MKASSADKNMGQCPMCRDLTTSDLVGRGFVRHLHNPNCPFERGERDLDGPYGLYGPYGQKAKVEA